MKRLTKKYLMILITVVALFTLTVFAVSADDVDPATCDHKLYPSYEGNVIAPNCTEDGYTEVVCGNCDTVIGRVPGSDVPAKGHKYTWTMGVNGDHYENNGQCSVCKLNVKERDDAGKVVIYYGVSLYNPAVAKSYDANIPYAKVVTERVGIADAKFVDVIYVKANTAIADDAALLKKFNEVPATCEKDAEYGEYKLLGWYDNEFVLIDAEPATTQSILYSPETLVTENISLYAGFQGDGEVTYTVKYYNYNGVALASSKAVPHGAASVYKLDTPTRGSDAQNRYKFQYWAYDNKEVDLTAIYGDVSVLADYLAIPREYNIKYFTDETCTVPIFNADKVVEDSHVKYGDVAPNGYAIPVEALEKARDDQYVYAWTGQWVMANRQDYVVSLSSFSVPEGTPDLTDGSTEIRLIPKYVKNPRVYELEVTVLYPDDNNYHPEDVYIQVLYSNGKVAGGQYATKINDSTYKYTFLVNHSVSYTIAATSTGYESEKVSPFVSGIGPSGAIITMEKVPAFNCGCICHTIFKPLWVRILNILYSLFGYEHVCCNDMFANIGPSLNYGPGKN